ncbi:MAG: AAA family ATPase [Candidatus Woesearchaeota archaeon]
MVKITVSGHPGAGKTTFCKILSERLGLNHYYMGGIIREMASRKGKKLEEFYKSLSNDPEGERKLDFYQKELGEKEENFIMEGRTSFFFIPDSIKIFLSVRPEVGAERIHNEKKGENKRNENNYETIEETLKANNGRLEEEKRRYMQLYGIDHHDPKNFDYHIDTTYLNPEEVVEEFLNSYSFLK